MSVRPLHLRYNPSTCPSRSSVKRSGDSCRWRPPYGRLWQQRRGDAVERDERHSKLIGPPARFPTTHNRICRAPSFKKILAAASGSSTVSTSDSSWVYFVLSSQFRFDTLHFSRFYLRIRIGTLPSVPCIVSMYGFCRSMLYWNYVNLRVGIYWVNPPPRILSRASVWTKHWQRRFGTSTAR